MQSITSSDDEEAFGDKKAGTNSCRECIEWMYRDLKILWAITSTKLLNDFIKTDNIVDTCLIFNAWNCINGNETSQYFKSPPPSFETYTSLGPR